MLRIEITIEEISDGVLDVQGAAQGEGATNAEAGCASDLCTILCEFLEEIKLPGTKPAVSGASELH